MLLTACTQEDFSQPGTGDAMSLSISVTDSGFNGTSRAAENGYATAFTEGDACGLYLVRDGRIVYDNVKLTATAGDDGAITWQPEEDLNGALDGESYFLYYPYQSGLSAPSDLSDLSDQSDDAAFFGPLIASWQPAADQSDYAAYTASDLMTAQGRIVRNGASKTVLSFDMTHRMALAVVELPKTVYKFTNPDISDYTVTTVADFTGSDAKPCRMADGSYRYIVNPFRGAETSITGTYTDGSKEFTLTTGNMAVGHYKTYRVDGAPVTEKEHTLQAGDYFYSDGTIVAGSEADPPSEGCIGIVFYAGQHESDRSNYSTTGIGQKKCHGYAVALTDATTNRCMWSAHEKELGCYPTDASGNRLNNLYYPNTDWSGYKWTWEIITAAGGKDDLNAIVKSDYPATFYAVVEYGGNVKAPANSSGWFLPSIGQLYHIYNYIVDPFDPNNLETGLKPDWYWSSSEYSSYARQYALGVDIGFGGRVYDHSKQSENYVRSVIAF